MPHMFTAVTESFDVGFEDGNDIPIIESQKNPSWSHKSNRMRKTSTSFARREL